MPAASPHRVVLPPLTRPQAVALLDFCTALTDAVWTAYEDLFLDEALAQAAAEQPDTSDSPPDEP